MKVPADGKHAFEEVPAEAQQRGNRGLIGDDDLQGPFRPVPDILMSDDLDDDICAARFPVQLCEGDRMLAVFIGTGYMGKEVLVGVDAQ